MPVSEELYAELRRYFSEEQLIELAVSAALENSRARQPSVRRGKRNGVRTAPPRWCKNPQRPPYQPAATEHWSEGRRGCNRLWFHGRRAALMLILPLRLHGKMIPSQMNATVPKRSTPTESISGLIERVAFFNEESGFCVLRVPACSHFQPEEAEV
jgi:hypothetical protein